MSKNDEKKEKTGLIQLETLKDFVHLIVHTPFQIVNHIDLANKHYYFIVIGGLPGFSRLIYFYSQDTEIKENFIIYNNLQDTINFGDKLETRGGITYLPIIHIKKQNIIKPEEFTF
ncbi:MAG: hypothetical protein HWN66_15115 [Candidatus Helarchaeota archaeon]|nr:hypothetical protein [Candidatus Helarchaeota archaeon]